MVQNCIELNTTHPPPCRYQTNTEGKSIAKATAAKPYNVAEPWGIQKQAVNLILFQLSICKNIRENEVLKNKHNQAHLNKNERLVKKKALFPEALKTARKIYVLACIFLQLPSA